MSRATAAAGGRGSPNAARAAAAAPLAAFVLHRWDWSETSLIVDLFTRERGRLAAAAKGAKRPTSQLRPVLMPFQALAVQLGRTPADEAAEIHLLRQAEWAGGVPSVRGAALFSGFYLNELLLGLLPRDDAHPVLFDAYAETIEALRDADEAQRQYALRAFELRLLRELGWLPALDVQTLTLAPLDDDQHYRLDAESGVGMVPAGQAQGLPARALRALEAALEQPAREQGRALRSAVAPVAAVLRTELRAMLHYHLGTTQLRTRQAMLDVQRLTTLERARR